MVLSVRDETGRRAGLKMTFRSFKLLDELAAAATKAKAAQS